MARTFLVPIDLSNLELRNALAQLLGSDPTGVEGKFIYNTTDHTIHFYNGTAWIVLGRLDQITAPTADVSLNSHKITSLATPTAGTDAATKAYVDALSQGVAFKESVRVASTVNGALATAYENADTLDGVVLATGDRILLKAQTAGAENGIYTVNASGAPTRALDADSTTDIENATVLVDEGTAAGQLWNLTTDAVTLGTTAQVWAQIGAATMPVAGGGLTLTGSTLDIGAGTGITVNADTIQLTIPVVVSSGGTGATTLAANGVLLGSGTSAIAATAVGATGTVLRGQTGAAPIYGAVVLTTDVTGALPVANGGTGGADAATAKTNLAFMTRYATSFGDGAATSYTITHNLGTLDVTVAVYRNSDGVEVECDVTRATTNTVTLVFAVAPTSNALRVVVIG